MTNGTTDRSENRDVERSHNALEFVRALNEFTAMIRSLRAEDLTREDRALLQRVLDELVSLNGLSDETVAG